MINHIAYANLIECLIDGATVVEMVDECGLHEDTVRRAIRTFRKQGIVYISRWTLDRAGKLKAAVFKLGRGNDAVRIPKTSTQLRRDYRARRRQAQLLGIV